MKKTLQFLVTHWITLLCGAAAVGAIVLCVMGMTSDKVPAEMKEAINRSGASGITSIKGAPQNEATIRREQERGLQFEQQYKDTIAIANQINARQVLMPGVFPTPEKTATPFEFKQKYALAVGDLYKEIDGGTLPTPAEIQEEEQNVADLRLLEDEQKAEELENNDTTRTPIAGGDRSRGGTTDRSPRGRSPLTEAAPIPRGGTDRGRGRGRGDTGGGGRGGDTSSARASGEPKYDPVFRAQVEKAKSIRCYYDATTFQTSPIVENAASPPREEMWFAQVGLWVQQDVVRAVAELNEEATKNLDDLDPCVQQSPVKHLVAVRVHGYEVEPSATAANGRVEFSGTNVPPAGCPTAVSPTGRKSDSQFDVIRFGVTAVMDQRDILLFIDKMTKTNFYQCINARYQIVNQEEAMRSGYFYGAEPSVLASFEFEGYMSREVYQPLMPLPVKTMLGIASE